MSVSRVKTTVRGNPKRAGMFILSTEGYVDFSTMNFQCARVIHLTLDYIHSVEIYVVTMMRFTSKMERRIQLYLFLCSEISMTFRSFFKLFTRRTTKASLFTYPSQQIPWRCTASLALQMPLCSARYFYA